MKVPYNFSPRTDNHLFRSINISIQIIFSLRSWQQSEFLVPSQFQPQHFPVELPFQLKRSSLYALCYFTDVQHFSVIRKTSIISEPSNFLFQLIFCFHTMYKICCKQFIFFFRPLVKINALRLFDSSRKDEKIQRKHLSSTLKLAYGEAEDDIKVRTR